MRKLKKLFSIVIAGCLTLGSMTGGIVQAADESAADECVVADFGDLATVERIAAVQNYYDKATDITYNGSESSLKITVPSWGFYLTDAGNKAIVPAKTDVSSYKYFRMRIYSENKGDSFVVMLSSDNSVDSGAANRRFVVTTQGTGWQEVAVRLEDSINNGAEWNNIGGVYLKTGVNSTSTVSGHTIYIDKIWFGNTAGDEMPSDSGMMVADFSDSTVSAAKAAEATNIDVENNTTVTPGKTAVKWTFDYNIPAFPVMRTAKTDVSEYDNVRIRFYSAVKGEKFVVLATYKAEAGIYQNPYFYYVITSNGNGWQDLKIPKGSFIAGGDRPIEEGGENVKASWSNISGIHFQIGGWDANPTKGNSIYIDSILFENDEIVDPKPPEEVKEPVIIADFANNATVEGIAAKADYLSKSTDRTYRKAASSLKVTFPDYGFYVTGADGKAMVSPVKDVSQYKYFRMRIYSKHKGDSFVVFVRSGDTDIEAGGTHFRGIVTTTGAGWQEVAIPLSAFDNRGGSWTNVDGIYLRTQLSGTSTTDNECMYIDKIWFGDTDGSEDKIDHICSDELYIDETEAVINGFYGMTVAQVRENILLPDNADLTFFDAVGNEITDESIPAVSGMTLTLTNGDEYLLDAALYDFRDIKFNGSGIKKFEQGSLNVELNARCYRQGVTVDANVIVAQYSNDGSLIGINYNPGIITSADTTKLSVNYEVNTVENTKIKVYVWSDFGTMIPLMDKAIELQPVENN